MSRLFATLARLPMSARVGLVCIVLALAWLAIPAFRINAPASTPTTPMAANASPTAAPAATLPPTDALTPMLQPSTVAPATTLPPTDSQEPGLPPTDAPATSGQPPTQAQERYLGIVQAALAHYAPPLEAATGELSPDEAPLAFRPIQEWRANVIETDAGKPAAVAIVIPIDVAATSADLMQQAKERLAIVVNALFVADLDLERVGIIATFQAADGEMRPGISLFVQRSASPAWGAVSASELERIAQSIYVQPDLLRP